MGLITTKAKKAYFDTNLFIYLIEENPQYKENVVALIQHLETIGCKIFTSELTLAECLVKPFSDNDINSQENYKASIKSSKFLTVIPVSSEILIKAAQLRGSLKNKLPDSIHLASAIKSGCDIFVGNDKKIKTNSEIELLLLGD